MQLQHSSCTVPRAHHAKGTLSAWGCSNAALWQGPGDNATKQQPHAPGTIFLPPVKMPTPVHHTPSTEEQSHSPAIPFPAQRSSHMPHPSALAGAAERLSPCNWKLLAAPVPPRTRRAHAWWGGAAALLWVRCGGTQVL